MLANGGNRALAVMGPHRLASHTSVGIVHLPASPQVAMVVVAATSLGWYPTLQVYAHVSRLMPSDSVHSAFAFGMVGGKAQSRRLHENWGVHLPASHL